LKGLWDTAKATFTLYPDKGARDLLSQPVHPVHAKNPLVQIQSAQIESAIGMEETPA